MNKYSKRALKTTATVGMSLAMVLSGVAAPLTNVKAAVGTCTIPTAHTAKLTVLDSYVTGINLSKLTGNTKIDIANIFELNSAGTGVQAPTTNLDQTDPANVKVNVMAFLVANRVAILDYFVNTGNSAESSMSCADNFTDWSSQRDKAQKILDVLDGVAYLNGKVNAVDNFDFTDQTTTNINAAITLADELADEDYETYATNNLTSSEKDALADAKEQMDAFIADNGQTGSVLNRYVKDLKEGLTEFIKTNKTATDSITKTEVDTAIKTIKEGGTFGGKAVTKTNYRLYGNIDAVQTIMSELEAMYDSLTDVKDALNSQKNDAYKAFVKGTTSVSDRVKAFTTEKDLMADISTDDYAVLKDFKENVYDVVYTLKSDKISGLYFDDSEKSVFATQTQLTTVKNLLPVAVLESMDDKDGLFVWDDLEAHMTKIEESLKTVEGLKNFDAVTIQAGDKDALVKFDDAVYYLTHDAYGNLNKEETRIARDADKKTTELLEAYRKSFGSIATTNGWINKGNGDWAFYENGAAPTKWVAARSDWYYVKDGKMLRNSWVANNSTGSKWYYVNNEGKMVSNTTVNGYAFDANGVWVK